MDLRQFLKSLQYAARGMRHIYLHEQNIRIQTLIAFFVLGFGYFFQLQQSEWIVILLLIALVLILEVVNSVIEQFIDIVKPRYHIQVQVVKDMLAAMVLLAAITSIIIGSVIFLPHIIEVLAFR